MTDAKAIGLGGIKLWLVEIFYYIFPNLEKFDVRDFAIHAVTTPWTSFGLAVAYAVVYIVLLLTAAVWIFDKKEI